ncbi:MAG: pyrroline-5-carboxylate reductase [Propionibacteriaceae bacterium]|jgi:pyrroline-5-carboxylate reductase|nr:pyrroline-5-carboxylate reductase [Propionibacteriaceae bacterium]
MGLSGERVAFIGGGVMGETVLAALVAGGFPAVRLIVSGPHPEKLTRFTERYGVATTTDNKAAARESDVVILATKPYQVLGVLAEIGGQLKPGALVISLAAGLTTEKLERALPEGTPVIRVMPNTPSQVGAGMSAISPGGHATDAEVTIARTIMEACGEVVIIDEKYQDAVTAVSGSGPAYIFLVAQAMIDAGVRLGLTRQLATQLTEQTILGAARLMLETGEHPTVLKEMVTSPGGTTAQALGVLEAYELRTAFTEAMQACYEKSIELGR